MILEEQLVVISAFLVRLVIPFIIPKSSSNLQQVIELSTMITSFKSLKEGIFLYSNGIDIYDGGVVYHSPLLILLMDYFIDLAAILYPVLDAIITYHIIQISSILTKRYGKEIKLAPWVIGLCFALNPIAILSNIGRSTVIFNNLFIVLSFYYSLAGNTALSAVFITVAAYLSYTSVYLIIPMIKLTYESNRSILKLFIFTTLTATTLLIISYKVSNDSWKFLDSTYGVIIKFNKIAPNLGLWWYYFTEMFDFFIPFYILVFNLYSVGFIIPLTLRLNGTFSFILSIGWLTFSKSYPELGDLALYVSLLLLLQSVFKYLTYYVFSFMVLIHTVILSPIFYHLWIGLGSGNSNFFYAITLVYSLGISSTIADFCWGYLVQEYHETTGNKNINKKLSQI